MVKLQIGASVFFCDTAEEAVRIHRLVGSNGVAVQTHIPAEPVRASTNEQRRTVQLILKKLEPLAGKVLNSEEMAKVIGAKGTNGLGPKMHQMRKLFTIEGSALDDFVVKHKPDPLGPTSWIIQKRAD